MLWIIAIIFSIVGVIFSGKVSVDKKFNNVKKEEEKCANLCLIVCILIIVAYGISENVVKREQITTEPTRYNLVSMQNLTDKENEQKYFYTQTGDEYYFLYETINGGYATKNIPSNNTVIYEIHNEMPYVLEYTTYTKIDDKAKFLKFLFLMRLEENVRKSYEIYI